MTDPPIQDLRSPVFAAPRTEDGTYPVAINLGAPINGNRDDLGFIIDPANKTGYFTSNRPGGKGDDDIYSFQMHTPLEQRYLCTGTVIDDDTGLPLIEVEVFAWSNSLTCEEWTGSI